MYQKREYLYTAFLTEGYDNDEYGVKLINTNNIYIQYRKSSESRLHIYYLCSASKISSQNISCIPDIEYVISVCGWVVVDGGVDLEY